jgi:PAS domain S-box-containing protein
MVKGMDRMTNRELPETSGRADVSISRIDVKETVAEQIDAISEQVTELLAQAGDATEPSSLLGPIQTLDRAIRELKQRYRRQEHQASLRESDAHLAALVESSMDAIESQTLDGHILTWNLSAARLYGYSAEEMLGQLASILVPADHEDEVPTRIARVIRGEPVEPYETILQRKDGTLLDVSLTLSPIKDGAGQVIGTATIARDISERKRLERQVEQYALQLARSNRELQDFAYVASHDLQEPLRKIQAFADRLKKKYATTLGDEGSDYLERMQSAAQRMQLLIQDLLALSRISTGGKPVVPVALGQVAREVVVDLSSAREESGATVEIGDLPTIEADPTQIRQLLQNLLSNALKFRREAVPPLIRVQAELLRAPVGQQVRITVQDNGIGFEEKYRERIFTPFERLHGRDEYAGTGMGLAICRRIVERHGGTIEAHGTAGAGATFCITLPIDQSQEVV